MGTRERGYWARLFDALFGRREETPEPVATEPAAADEGVAELKGKLAGLEMDVQERDAKIEEMRKEYEALEAAKERAVFEAGQGQLEQVFKQVAGPLSNLMALVELAEVGRDVQAGDLAQLARDLEKQLERFGLQPVGQAGEETEFDAAVHQRMSGGGVRAGTPVRVRMPGYRLGEKVLLKAMVSAKAEE